VSPFAHCFRCGKKVGLGQYLTYTNFPDKNLIRYLDKISKVSYVGTYTRFSSTNTHHHSATYVKLLNQHQTLYTQNYEKYTLYMQYLYERCLDIDPIMYYMSPNINKHGELQVAFYNSDGHYVTARNVENKTRYDAQKNKKLYYFQTINKITEYQHIVICEGQFDAVNLHLYSPFFKNGFFLALGGSNYTGIITDLIMSFLLIGKYTIHVVFDQNVYRAIDIMDILNKKSNILNPKISFKFYYPIITKDVSDLMMLQQIERIYKS